MSRTLWSILVIGFLTLVLMVMALLLVLKGYSESPYSTSTKLAIAIKNEFQFDSVGTVAEVAPTSDGLRSVLKVSYDTHVDTKFDVDVQNREMDRVAKFAAEKSDAEDRRRFVEIQVRRIEFHNRGCFHQKYQSERTVPNPFRLQPLPLPPPPR